MNFIQLEQFKNQGLVLLNIDQIKAIFPSKNSDDFASIIYGAGDDDFVKITHESFIMLTGVIKILGIR